jgi:small conductance mechanosensitive channel
MQAGKEALDAAGIEIPFPHQVEVPSKGTSFARIVATPAVEPQGD